MKISKHLHSCLVVEEAGKRILIDPGNYTFEEGALDVEKMEKLDLILITHEHLDHACPPFIKKLLERFPEVTILANSSVSKILSKDGIFVRTPTSDKIQVFLEIANAPHELLLGGRFRTISKSFCYSTSFRDGKR